MNNRLVATVSLALLAGCASVPEMPEPDRSWQSYSGQLQYVAPGHSVIGEFVASRNGSDFRLDFSKGGAVPLIRVSRHEQFARAEGALARGRWQGDAAKAPGPLEAWVNEVPRAFAGLGPVMIATRNATHVSGGEGNGAARKMEIEGAKQGERFVFIFSH